MFLIWGFRTKSALLARLMLICRFCSNPAAQTLVQRKRFFTLFFMPIIPLGGPRILQCSFCGQASKLEKDQADALVAQARVQSGQDAPQGGQGGYQGGQPQVAMPQAPVGPPAEQIPLPPAQAS